MFCAPILRAMPKVHFLDSGARRRVKDISKHSNAHHYPPIYSEIIRKVARLPMWVAKKELD
jgi:hypothetical protein